MSDVASKQVSWWPVYEFVASRLEGAVDEWPLIGTPAWCCLPDDDARKYAAVLDAGRHYALRLETTQEAQVQAAEAVRDAADWPTVARNVRDRDDFYRNHPWMRRAA